MRVVAAGKVPRASGDRVKTDRRDAVKLATLVSWRGILTSQSMCQNSTDEAVRDLCRARTDAVQDCCAALKKARPQLLKGSCCAMVIAVTVALSALDPSAPALLARTDVATTSLSSAWCWRTRSAPPSSVVHRAGPDRRARAGPPRKRTEAGGRSPRGLRGIDTLTAAGCPPSSARRRRSPAGAPVGASDRPLREHLRHQAPPGSDHQGRPPRAPALSRPPTTTATARPSPSPSRAARRPGPQAGRRSRGARSAPAPAPQRPRAGAPQAHQRRRDRLRPRVAAFCWRPRPPGLTAPYNPAQPALAGARERHGPQAVATGPAPGLWATSKQRAGRARY